MSRLENTPSIYSPLAAEGEIRLLRLIVDLRSDRQHRDTSPLKCELRTSKLGTLTTPAYTALSYCWGPACPEHYIDINGSKLKITPNLDVALRHIQRKWLESLVVDLDNPPPPEDSIVKSGWFWIDAICINQSDNSEKEKQVPQMTEIYKYAKPVLVWLGKSDPEMDILSKLLGPIGKAAAEIGVLNLTYEEMLNWPRSLTAERAEALKSVKEKVDGLIRRVTRGDLGGGSFSLAAFIRLTKLEWFTRVWVLQEFAVADQVIFACGDMRIEEKEFAAAMVFCSLWIIDQIQYLAAVFLFGWRWAIIAELLNWWEKNGWQFFRVFWARVSPDTRPFHTLQLKKDYQNEKADLSLDRLLVRCFSQDPYGQPIGATKPRDRVYALFNISSDKKNGIEIPYDYKNDCVVVYINAAKAMLENGHVDILGLCRRLKEAKAEEPKKSHPLISLVLEWIRLVRKLWYRFTKQDKENCREEQISKIDPREVPHDLPTWVPDWNLLVPRPWCGRKEDGLFRTNIRDPVKVSFNGPNNRILCLEGRRVGVVSEIGKV